MSNVKIDSDNVEKPLREVLLYLMAKKPEPGTYVSGFKKAELLESIIKIATGTPLSQFLFPGMSLHELNTLQTHAMKKALIRNKCFMEKLVQSYALIRMVDIAKGVTGPNSVKFYENLFAYYKAGLVSCGNIAGLKDPAERNSDIIDQFDNFFEKYKIVLNDLWEDVKNNPSVYGCSEK